MAGTAKVDITATITGAVALTANVPAVTMRTVRRDGSVITARACAGLANAAAQLTTSAIIRSAWMASAGTGNAVIINNAKGDSTVTRGYAKRTVHQTAVVRTPSAVQSTIHCSRTEFAKRSRKQTSFVQ